MSTEHSLRLLHLLAEHALNDAQSEVAQCRQAHDTAESHAHRAAIQHQQAQDDWAVVTQATSFQPSTYDALRRFSQFSHAKLQVAQSQLNERQQALDLARQEMGRCRQRESDMARTLNDAQAAQRRARQIQDDLALDDLWLQSKEFRG